MFLSYIISVKKSLRSRENFIAICINDIDKAAFYKNLGMRLVWKETDWAYLKAGEDGLALLSPGYHQASTHFRFVLSDAVKDLTY